ncbi:MAG: hemerythrin family protein [Oscillospiraceae bacterium]
MRIFSWNKELESGIEQIDAQHKQLLETANSLIIRGKCGNGALAVSENLGYLEKYTQYHFQSEEAFQVNSGYSGYREHQALHLSISTQLKFLSVKLDQSNYNEKELENFYQFFIDWIKNHILVEDLKFAKFYKQYLVDCNRTVS